MTKLILVLVLFFACLLPLSAACRKGAPGGGDLEEQLHATYVSTLMDANGFKVIQPGCVLVVQLDGIAACPSTKTAVMSVYEDGQVASESKSSILNAGKKIGALPIPGIGGSTAASGVPYGATACPGGTGRAYTMGEKVYLVKFEIRDQRKDTGLIFSLQSCGTCDPAAADPAHKPYRADLRVSLNKGFLASTDLKSIERVVGEVLAFPEDAASSADHDQPAASASQPSFAPIAPPPPAVPEPVAPSADVAAGMTPDQVKAALGEPLRVVKAGNKEIHTYKDLKVTFVNGRVSDIE